MAREAGPATRKGALAGLSWDERREAVAAHWKASDKEDDLASREAAMQKLCSASIPPKSLLDAHLRLKKQMLMDLARDHRDKIKGRTDRMSKAQLARALAAPEKPLAAYLLEYETLFGERDLSDLRRLVEQGGTVPVSFEEGSLFIPLPFIPYIQIHRMGDGYVAWLAPELAERLKDTDWEAQLARARAADDAVGLVEKMVELRGTVERRDALSELSATFDEDLVNDALDVRMDEGVTSFAEVGRNGGADAFFVHSEIVETARSLGDRPDLQERLLSDVYVEQKKYVPRDVCDLSGHDTVLDLVETYGSYRRLIAYLDAHVPQGADEYEFADELATEVVLIAQGASSVYEMQKFIRDISEPLFFGTELEEVTGLMTRLAEDVPRWTLNGWSTSEARAVFGHVT